MTAGGLFLFAFFHAQWRRRRRRRPATDEMQNEKQEKKGKKEKKKSWRSVSSLSVRRCGSNKEWTMSARVRVSI